MEGPLGSADCIGRLEAALRTREEHPVTSDHTERPLPSSQRPPKLTISLRLTIQVIKAILTKQVTAPVQWETIMNGLIDGGFEKGYELGPGKVLSGIMKRISKAAVIENIEV
mgnify:CR=1 FL=1